MAALATLRACLETPPRRKDKAPTGFDRQLQATSKAVTENVWVTLLKVGFQAWYAYFTVDLHTRTIVDQLSLLEQQVLAKELCEIVPHEDVKELFQHLFDVADRGDSRHRCLEACGCHAPPYIRSRKRRRTELSYSPEPTTGTTAVAPCTLIAPNPFRQPLPGTLPGSVVSDAAQESTTEGDAARNPSIEGDAAQQPTTEGRLAQELKIRDKTDGLPLATHLSGIFPPMLLSSIVKQNGKAQVKAVQPKTPERSRLNFSIYPHRVPYLAREIFDLDADVKDMLLQVRFEHGGIATVLQFEGARHDALDRCFGLRVARAIRSSGRFAAEIQEGAIVTKCVSLKIKRDPEFSCWISLVIDPDSLSPLLAEIWPLVHHQ